MGKRSRSATTFILALFLSFAATSASAHTDTPDSCETVLTEAVDLATQEAITNFQAFFTAIETQLFERGFFLNVAKLALLSKEHVLMLGPPGNAKSMGVDLIIDNIIDKDSGETSVFKIQMTPETSLSETHGVIDYKKITEENIQTRKWDQGLLSAKLVFIDEFFDARANAIRNNLMALNEREHAQGRERIKGLTESGFAASNKYIHEVFEKAGDDGPKAIIDRFAFVSFIPGELSELRSALKLIQEKPAKHPGRITFQEIDLLREKVKDVTIPDYVGRMLTLIFTRMKAQSEALEESEKKRYVDQKKSGLTPLPPYRSTKYFSPRTLRKAGKILRAIVVLDWIEKGGARALSANSEDLEKLSNFFTLNSLDDQFLTHLEETTLNPFEKIQVMTVLKERGMFRDIYQEMMNEVNARTAILTEIEVERESAVTPELKQALIEKMFMTMMHAILSSEEIESIQKLSEANLANEYIRESVESSLRELLGADYDNIIKAKVKKVEEDRIKERSEARRLEQERVARERKEARDREIRRRKEEAAREASILRMQKFRQAFSNPEKVKVLSQNNYSGMDQPTYALTPVNDEGKWQLLSLHRNATIVEYIDLKSGKIVDKMTLPAIEITDQIHRITAMEDGRFLFWFGRYGRILDLKGLGKRKIIHETSDMQTISENSRHGEVWLIDNENKKIGVVSGKDFSEVEWKETSSMSLVDASGSRVEPERFHNAMIDFEGRTILSSEKGVAFTFSRDGDGAVLTYRIDLNKSRIEIHKQNQTDIQHSVLATEDSVAATFSPRMVNAVVDSTSAQKVEFRVSKVAADIETTAFSVPIARLNMDYLNHQKWDISPDATSVVASYGTRLYLINLADGETIQITLANCDNNETIEQVTFVDQNHVMLRYPNGYALLRLPTADE